MRGIPKMQTLIDQTHAIIQMEIDQVLEEYPYAPYRQAFTEPDRHQALTDYILTHISKLYANIDIAASHLHRKNSCIVPDPNLFPTAVGLTIEILIHQGIQEILHENTAIEKPSNRVCSWQMATS
jgi:hypothetical protein